MSSLVMNASKNEEYLKDNSELVHEARKNDDGSSVFSNSEIKEVYIPPEEEQRLLEMFATSVVQDFGDDYHLTRKERDEMQERYQKFFKLKKNYTRKIRRLDKFVEAWRLCIEIIDDMADTNGLYDPAKFKQKALSGAIHIDGLNFPKFQGKRKKKINWDYVTEFIFDPRKDLRELTDVKELAEESQRIDIEHLMSDEEISEVLTPLSEEERTKTEYRATVGIAETGNADEMSKKAQKWLVKGCPAVIQNIKDAAKVPGDTTRRKSKIWDSSDEELEILRAYDSKLRGNNSISVPEFNGNFGSTKAVDAYLRALDEYEEETSFVSYNGRLITESEYKELEYMHALEDAGWNIRNLYDNRDKDKRAKQAKKDEQERINTLRKMLNVAQEREDLRSKGYSEKEIDAILKKQEEVGKKNKKKKKKAKKTMDSIILDAVKSKDKSFKKYKKRMGRM